MITQVEREQFERDGYLLFDCGVPLSVLDAITAELDARFETRESDGESRKLGRITDAWKFSTDVKSLATAPRVLALLQGLYGRKPIPFQTLNFPTGTEQRVHSDAVHFNTKPSGYMCGVWVALEDIDRDNGPVEYYPGSHKLPEITVEDVDRAGFVTHSYAERFKAALHDIRHVHRPGRKYSEHVYTSYEAFIGEMIRDLGIEPQYATLKKGQALLWAANLLHGGSPQRDKRRTRLSQVTHYFFEGCQYYTPRMGGGNKVSWRNSLGFRVAKASKTLAVSEVAYESSRGS
jgi:ectoine hydroxylase-related dioxygenase (phytanoyl-CoA dioxygenase family)